MIIAAFNVLSIPYATSADVAEATLVTVGTDDTAEVMSSALYASVTDSAIPALATDVIGSGVADPIIAALSVSSNPYAISADVADTTLVTVGTSATAEAMSKDLRLSVILSAIPALATEVTGPVAAEATISALMASSNPYAIAAEVADATLVTVGTSETAEVIIRDFNSSVIDSATPALATDVTGPVAADATIASFNVSSIPYAISAEVADTTLVIVETAATAESTIFDINVFGIDSAIPALATDVTGAGVAEAMISFFTDAIISEAIPAEVAYVTLETLLTAEDIIVFFAAVVKAPADAA